MPNHLSYRSGNPVLTSNAFNIATDQSDVMTINGTVNKTFLLLFIVIASGYFAWNNLVTSMYLAFPAAMMGLVIAFLIIFNKKWISYLAPIYAVSQGIFLGMISYYFNSLYDGIAITAISYTLCILFGLLSIYRLGIIKPTENFKLGVGAATSGVFLIYMVNFVMRFFGTGIPLMDITNASIYSIGFSVFVIIIAAANLVIDFDFIEEGAEKGAPKYMEWYGAFGLMVTLIWLYFEILKLLAKLNSRRLLDENQIYLFFDFIIYT